MIELTTDVEACGFHFFLVGGSIGLDGNWIHGVDDGRVVNE